MAETIEQKIQRIESICNEANTTLLSKKPSKKTDSLKFVCAKGHQFSKRLDVTLWTGADCQQCKRDKNKAEKNTARAKQIADANGAVLISKIVLSTKEKIEFRCAQNHTVIKSIDKLSTPPFCGKCAKQIAQKEHGAKQLSEINKFAKQNGLQLLSTEYVNNRTLMKWRCDASHVFEARWDNIQQGHRCPFCSGSKVIGGLVKRALNLADKNGGILISEKVSTSKQKLEWQCQNGHQFKARLDHVHQGSWCFECAHGPRHTIELMRTVAEQRGGKCLKELQRTEAGHSNFLWECSEGHQWQALGINVFNKGKWCAQCSTGIGERFTRIAFETIFNRKFSHGFFDWLKNPATGRRLQLDGFNAELNIAFEHQGYLHSQTPSFVIGTPAENQAFRDQQKRKICKERGVTLIEVPEVPRLLPLEDLTNFLVEQLQKQGIKVPVFEEPNYLPAYSVKKLQPLINLARSKGGEVLESAYKGATTKHLLRCASGHQWEATPDTILNAGTWCPVCAGNKLDTPALESVQKIVAEKGGTLISTSIENTRSKIIIECEKGHQFSTQVAYFLRNKNWCRACSGRFPVTLERAREMAKKHDGECVEFINQKGSHKRFLWRCSNGHTWEANFDNVQKGKWCAQCK